MTDEYAVIGNPIGHSKSPQIHAAFACQTKQNLNYTAQLVELGQFEKTIAGFIQQGMRGINVTVPFKNEAFDLATELSPRAQSAGAVNTLMFSEGRIYGDNTDGAGLVKDLTQNHQITLQGKRILILGAGGAVQGVLLPIIEQQPASITIANRTASKAIALANKFNEVKKDCAMNGGGFDDLTGQFDIVINGTAASLQGEVPPLPDNLLSENAVCYDMMYAVEPTAFVQWGQQHDAQKSLDGLGMLVEQAAESFFIWREVKPDTTDVIHTLRSN